MRRLTMINGAIAMLVLLVAVILNVCSAQQQQGGAPMELGAAAKMKWGAVLTPSDVTDDTCAEAIAMNQHARDAMETVFPGIPPQKQQRSLPVTNGRGCIFIPHNWWSYEFCYGRWIRQFHEEKGVVHAEYILGLASGAGAQPDPIVDTPLMYRDGAHSLRRKIGSNAPDEDRPFACSQRADDAAALAGLDVPPVVTEYVGGTVCDLTNRPRRSRVVAICEPPHVQLQTRLRQNAQHPHATIPPILFNVTEVAPCEYVVFLVGPGVCEILQRPAQMREAAQTAAERERLRRASDGDDAEWRKRSAGAAKQQPDAKPAQQRAQPAQGGAADSGLGEPVLKPTMYTRGTNGKAKRPSSQQNAENPLDDQPARKANDKITKDDGSDEDEAGGAGGATGDAAQGRYRRAAFGADGEKSEQQRAAEAAEAERMKDFDFEGSMIFSL